MHRLENKQPIGRTLPQRDHGFAISLMEHLVVPTFVIGPDSRVIIWNKACERLTGIPASEIVGTRDQWRGFYGEPRPCLVDLVLEGRYNEIRALYANAGSCGVSDFGVSAESWCLMPRVGRRLYLAIDVGPIYDEAGELIAVVETLRDVTLHKQAQTDLEVLAARDSLTGLANRRSFDLRFAEEVRRAARDGLHLSLLMIDVDCFKLYNDANGHQQGDECLRAVAREIAATRRSENDFSARYGGEEFVVVMPDASIAVATSVAESLRMAVENLSIPHASSSVADRVTLSIGGVVALGAETAPERLIASADAALYHAKRAGRNRVSVAWLDEASPSRIAARG